jgi:hypothetical protein
LTFLPRPLAASLATRRTRRLGNQDITIT